MTQILTLLASDFMLQVSDRLVSERIQRRTRPYDPHANKTVLFHTRDGIVSLSYSGLAYVDDVPMDHWMAGVLFGQPLKLFDEDRMPVLMSGQSPRIRKIGAALIDLCTGLEEEFQKLPEKDRIQHYVVICGIQRNRSPHHPARGVIYGIVNDADDRTRFTINSKSQSRDITKPALYPSPGPLSGKEIRSIVSDLANAEPAPGPAEAVLIEAMRRTAANHDTVSADCLTVTFTKDVPEAVRIRYVPATADPSNFYSPYIVTPFGVYYPSIIEGAHSIRSGSIAIRIEGSPTRPGEFGLTGQPRPPRPS